MRKILLCGTLMLLTAGNAAVVSAATYGEKDWAVDVLRPHGHARSQAAKLADGQACNNLAMRGARYDRAAFDAIFRKCTSAHGWRIVRSVRAPLPSAVPAEGGIDPITQSAIDASNAALDAQSNEETSAAGAAAAAASAGQ